MLILVGAAIVFAATIGGFMMAGGHPGVLLHVSEFVVIPVAMTTLTLAAVEAIGATKKDGQRAKNMFGLGLLSWMYGRELEHSEAFIREKFARMPGGCVRIVEDDKLDCHGLRLSEFTLPVQFRHKPSSDVGVDLRP